jgi:alpha-1,2-glucosyltransferase
MGRLLVAAAVAGWAIPITALVNSVVPEPYMVSSFSSKDATLVEEIY